MRVGTILHGGGTVAASFSGDRAFLLPYDDVGEWLAARADDARTDEPAGEIVPAASVCFAPLVTRPSKIICVGLNYKLHIEESGEQPPRYPTLFAKFASSLIGASDPIVLPRSSDRIDWEIELVAVIGTRCRHADEQTAAAAIAGFTVGNDISVRDRQARTSQWLEGKTFEATTPVGPYLVTTDEIGPWPDLQIRCEVAGEVMQDSRTSDLLFGPPAIVSYISEILTLEPGDLIFTGTPGGVGQGRKPQVFLQPGQSVSSTIEGIGTMLNVCVPEGDR
jgi:acylpyruvate hydrolase